MTERGNGDRRRALRARMHDVEAALETPSDVLVLSTGGMAIRMPAAAEVGSRHGFTIELAGTELNVAGVVRNVKDEGTGTFEVGVEFEGLAPDQSRRLEEFVRERKTREAGG